MRKVYVFRFILFIAIWVMVASSAVAQVDQGEIPIKLLREQAEQGDDRAQYKLGASYARGQGVKKDYVQAMEWYRKAAEQG